MSSLNDSLEKIRITDVLLIILALEGLIILSSIFGFNIDQQWLYVALVLYFIYRLRYFGPEFKQDFKNIFSKISIKFLVLIVLVNVFFSYGMLYVSIFLVDNIPGLSSLFTLVLFPNVVNSFVGVGGMLFTIFISPICEELLFRGVVLNRLKLFVPTAFAIILYSILFGVLHNYGNIISACVFGICMYIIYLKTNNILTCIFTHFLNNILAEILYFFDTGMLIFTNWVVIILFSILAIVSFYLIFTSIQIEWKHIEN